jgi:hypothetical protein
MSPRRRDAAPATRAAVEQLLASLAEHAEVLPSWLCHPRGEVQFCASILYFGKGKISPVYNDADELIGFRGIASRGQLN